MRIPGLEVCVARIEGADFVIPSLEVFPRRLGVGASAAVRSRQVPGRRPGRESFLYMGSSAGRVRGPRGPSVSASPAAPCPSAGP